MSHLLIIATYETLWMVTLSLCGSVLLGLPLGILLYIGRDHPHAAWRWAARFVDLIVNALRAFPFIILMVAMIPITRWLVGTSIGSLAAVVPLTTAAMPYYARLVEQALTRLPSGLTELGLTLGYSARQRLAWLLLPEALPQCFQAIILTSVNLIGYSSMAGAVGGGGLGALAINYGYQRFDMPILFSTVAILMGMVWLTQYLGDRWVHHMTSGKL